MCGIFGIIIDKESDYSFQTVSNGLRQLIKLSESRGKESAGLSYYDFPNKSMQVLKGPIPASEMMKDPKFKNHLSNIQGHFGKRNNHDPIAIIGHSRLVTDGSHLKDQNNQPTIKEGLVAIHNGIFVNHADVWNAHPELCKEFDIDTEVFLALLRKFLEKGADLPEAVSQCFESLSGTASLATFFQDRPAVLLATNNGSLYVATDHKGILVFASEKYILDKLLSKSIFNNGFEKVQVKQVEPLSGFLIDLEDFDISSLEAVNGQSASLRKNGKGGTDFDIQSDSIQSKHKLKESVIDSAANLIGDHSGNAGLLEYNITAINELTRCKKCLLPSTFPFIEFDNQGVCNVCRNHKTKKAPSNLHELRRLVAPYLKTNGQPECILPFSGGRDSSFAVHLVKKELGLKPLTFTYDWGMVTDLARRNIARICGELGVENIIVSANIRKKRDNIRKNISAWLKKPELGMIPLFMAGDKYFYYHTNQLKKKTGIKLNIWGINDLENTDFKVGFCGVGLDFDKKKNYSLNYLNMLKLFAYTGRNFLTNPSYLNSSLLDTLGSMYSRYMFPQKDHYHLFDYYHWDETEINKVLINTYGWETANDTKSTWRIGDGTASFYNYIYYTVAGFSEFDTFRSNQIRAGLISREEALTLVTEESVPRYESMKWYLDIVGINFEHAIKVINSIPKLYAH